MKKLAILAVSSLIFCSFAQAQDYLDDTSTTEVEDTGRSFDDTTYDDRSSDTSDIPGEVSVTSSEGLMESRETERFNFFRFGPATMINMDASGAGVYLGGGRIYNTHPQAAIKVAADTVFSGAEGAGTSSYLSASLGGIYYLDESDTAPNAFADLGYGYADAPELDSANGFTLGVGVGTAFFRSTDMQMDISARYQLMMSSNDDGAPSILALLLGLNFG